MRFSSLLVAFSALASGIVSARECKLIPGDAGWPSVSEWSALNSSISGHLVETIPIGSPCYTGDEAACEDIKSKWTTAALHEESSSSMQHPIFTNHSCSPFNDIKAGDVCEVGSYVPYAVDVHTQDDVITALAFATQHNLRVVVRNTGHDYIGRSTGKGALALWTHHLRDISWPSQDTVKVQAGVLGQEIMKAAHDKQRVVVAGNCPTVGYAGGFTAGGGHGMLTNMFGLSADQTLEFEVITTDGQVLTASPEENPELYRALSGGGAGTYAIVWSVTVKTHPDVPVAFATLAFPDGLAEDSVADVLRAHIAFSSSLTAQGVYIEILFFAPTLQIPLMLWYNHTQEEFDAVLAPYLAAIGDITDYTYSSRVYPTYSEMYYDQPGPQNTAVANLLWGGRLLPSSLFQLDGTPDPTAGGALQDVIDYYVAGSHSFYIDSVQLPESSKTDKNAVTDQWRDARGFLVPFYGLEVNDTEAIFATKRKYLTDTLNKPLVEITDGVYSNEADPDDPSFPTAFYGDASRYQRLLDVKDQYDPAGLLYGTHNVGSERWEEDVEGRLCKV